ncbi:hypothetical protein B0H10DRAFT_2322308 [Mycena sp. CBHHK59/15]|nr:hypothetical protein B0H10DRAFT_2322308 [Mycena sp. CBHHK59/15]
MENQFEIKANGAELYHHTATGRALHRMVCRPCAAHADHGPTALTGNSTGAIEWLTGTLGLGGHSVARTHRDKCGAPGWAITSALMKRLTALVGELGARAEIVKAADFAPAGLLVQHRAELLTLSMTNGEHATGNSVRLAAALAGLCDLDQVQVHPTGLVDPVHPDAKTKFFAAEALRGAGGLLLNVHRACFVDEVGRCDVVMAAMQAAAAPVQLVLGAAAAEEVRSHCGFYVSKGLMKRYAGAVEFAADAGILLESIQAMFTSYST